MTSLPWAISKAPGREAGFPLTDMQTSFLRLAETMAHIISWLYLFTFPILLFRNGEASQWQRFIPQIITTALMCGLFYGFYLYLIPRLMRKTHGYKRVIIMGLISALALALFLELLYNLPLRPYIGIMGTKPHHFNSKMFLHMGHFHFFLWGFVRNLMTFIATVGIAFTLHLAHRWQQSESERQKAETARAEAELRSLRHQLSPHFLLNSLNSIYSLIAFDSEKAQSTLIELSKMLRHQLYESNAQYVALLKEVEFLQNYISLMQTRITEDTRVTTEFDYDDGNLLIAPHLLINIVENAFKHGVQPTQHSHIDISLQVRNRCLTFVCRNTLKKKIMAHADDDDCCLKPASSGLGLKHVAALLKIYYPKCHEWAHGVSEDGRYYSSVIKIWL